MRLSTVLGIAGRSPRTTQDVLTGDVLSDIIGGPGHDAGEVDESAFRHRVSCERILDLLATAIALYNPVPVDPDEEDLVLFLGFDANGVPPEVMAIELDDGSLMVIHAMRLRRKYERRLRELYR